MGVLVLEGLGVIEGVGVFVGVGVGENGIAPQIGLGVTR